MVRDDSDDVHVELAAAPAPQQVEQAVVVFGDEQRDRLAPSGVDQAVLEPQLRADLSQPLLQRREGVIGTRQVELHPQREAAAIRVARELIGA